MGLWCLMIPYEAVQGYATLLGEVRAAGVADLDRLVASLSDLSDSEKYEALSDLLPDLGQRYEVAAFLEVSGRRIRCQTRRGVFCVFR